jgi:hypothetical protein
LLLEHCERIVMGQYAKGLDTTLEKREETLKSLESVKQLLMAWECGPSS